MKNLESTIITSLISFWAYFGLEYLQLSVYLNYKEENLGKASAKETAEKVLELAEQKPYNLSRLVYAGTEAAALRYVQNH